MSIRRIALAGLIAVLAACGGPDPVADGANNLADADIEVLPPDESLATPTNELANGAVNAPAEAAGNETP